MVLTLLLLKMMVKKNPWTQNKVSRERTKVLVPLLVIKLRIMSVQKLLNRLHKNNLHKILKIIMDKIPNGAIKNVSVNKIGKTSKKTYLKQEVQL